MLYRLALKMGLLAPRMPEIKALILLKKQRRRASRDLSQDGVVNPPS